MLTLSEAQRRAREIWGRDARVTAAVPTSSGSWWIDVGRKSHFLDANGQTKCHVECVERHVAFIASRFTVQS